MNKSLDNLKAISSSSIKAKSPPSPDQALLGAIIAGVIAVVLYRFTTSIEATLGRQTLSDNFSVSIISFVVYSFYLSIYIDVLSERAIFILDEIDKF